MMICQGTQRSGPSGVTRRDVLRVGALGLCGLTLGDVLRLQNSQAADRSKTPSSRGKSVIMIWLRGGASHIDSFDMKPAAPPEVRGEFHPIPTNVPGIEICEYMPRLATITDRLAILRGIRSNDLGDHTPHYILTGFPDRGRRPTLGAIVSYLHKDISDIPRYVSTFDWDPYPSSTYTGPQHRPFIPNGAGLANLTLRRELTLPRLDDRRQLLQQLDSIRRDVDRSRTFEGMDAFTRQAVEMITSTNARDAFDLGKEPPHVRERYGKYCESFLLARRLVEAGVKVVTLKVGDWDTHEHNFRDMREQLPQLDVGFHALVSDLHERGMADDVAVVLWGEFGRAPRVSRIAGRDHWPEAGAAVVAGGGFRTGQIIGETDEHAARSKGKPYTPSNILANFYRHLGIDPAITIPDFNNRPMHLLDDRELVTELL